MINWICKTTRFLNTTASLVYSYTDTSHQSGQLDALIDLKPHFAIPLKINNKLVGIGGEKKQQPRPFFAKKKKFFAFT